MIADFYYWWVPMMANTPAADPMISGNWIVHVIGAIATGAALFWGKGQRDRAKAAETETVIKGQPIGVVKHQQPVTWSDHINLVRRVDRIDQHLDAMRKEGSEQFKDLLEAASSREARIIDKIDDVARAIHARIDNWKGGAK